MKGPYLEASDINTSVGVILKAFRFAVPGGTIRGRSKNGREIVSGYVPYRGNQYDDGSKSKTRAFVQMAIRGSDQPYDIRMQYVIQTRTAEKTYKVLKYDMVEANKILKRFKSFLATRPDRDDLIDDFRAF